MLRVIINSLSINYYFIDYDLIIHVNSIYNTTAHTLYMNNVKYINVCVTVVLYTAQADTAEF